MVRDADPNSLPSSADKNAAKWVASSAGLANSNKPTRSADLPKALQLANKSEFDDEGREVLAIIEDGQTGTDLAKHYTVYEPNRTFRFPFWDSSSNKPLLPVEATAFDNTGKITESYTLDPSCTSAANGVPTGLGLHDQTNYVSWTRNNYDTATGKRTSTDRYHTIPASGTGRISVNFDRQAFAYDARGRKNMSKTPGGTITRNVFDASGRTIETYIGADDTGATDADPTGGNAPGNNMVRVAGYQYDGSGNLTQATQYVDAGTTRTTTYGYDWRNRRVTTTTSDGATTYITQDTLDNLGRATRTDRYRGSIATGNLIARSTTSFDDLGHLYQSRTFAVDPVSGAVGSALVNNAWYDAAGRTIKSQPPGSQTFTKTVYDGLGRTVKEYTGYNTAETGYPNPGQFVTDDTILEQAETTYDPAGHEILITIRSRLHDATGKGELTAPDGVQPRASVYYAAMWYDAAGRQTALADYGTNGGKPLMRVALAPAASDTVLVTSTEFDAAGRAVATIDPKGRVTQMKFDATGRAVATVQNYVQGGVGADQNITTQRTYTPDGAIATLTAVNPTTGNQVTRFIYGTSAGGAVPLVCRNDLLRAVIYPDSTNYLDGNGAFQTGPKGVYNRVEYTYNRQGQRLTMKDQNGTIHQYVYDPLGRQTQDQVIVLGTGVDGAVRRVARSYEVRGMVAKLTSYDAAAGGNVVNEVLRQYDALGRPVREYQEHRGAASSKSLSVQHNYADLATCGGRLSSIRYPNGRLVDYAYTSAAGASLSRPDAIAEDNNGVPGNTLSRYTYLGLDTIVAEDYPQPQVKLDYLGSASGRYAGFDNFGRVVQQLWQNYGTNQAVNQFRYGYDRASNRTWRQNVVSGHLTPPAPLDEFYTNDGDDRLIQLQRGTLNLQEDRRRRHARARGRLDAGRHRQLARLRPKDPGQDRAGADPNPQRGQRASLRQQCRRRGLGHRVLRPGRQHDYRAQAFQPRQRSDPGIRRLEPLGASGRRPGRRGEISI